MNTKPPPLPKGQVASALIAASIAAVGVIAAPSKGDWTPAEALWYLDAVLVKAPPN